MNSLHRNVQLSLGVFTSKHLLYVFDKRFLLSPHFSTELHAVGKLGFHPVHKTRSSWGEKISIIKNTHITAFCLSVYEMILY